MDEIAFCLWKDDFNLVWVHIVVCNKSCLVDFLLTFKEFCEMRCLDFVTCKKESACRNENNEERERVTAKIFRIFLKTATAAEID